jgi:hypothetical protein
MSREKMGKISSPIKSPAKARQGTANSGDGSVHSYAGGTGAYKWVDQFFANPGFVANPWAEVSFHAPLALAVRAIAKIYAYRAALKRCTLEVSTPRSRDARALKDHFPGNAHTAPQCVERPSDPRGHGNALVEKVGAEGRRGCASPRDCLCYLILQVAIGLETEYFEVKKISDFFDYSKKNAPTNAYGGAILGCGIAKGKLKVTYKIKGVAGGALPSLAYRHSSRVVCLRQSHADGGHLMMLLHLVEVDIPHSSLRPSQARARATRCADIVRVADLALEVGFSHASAGILIGCCRMEIPVSQHWLENGNCQGMVWVYQCPGGAFFNGPQRVSYQPPPPLPLPTWHTHESLEVQKKHSEPPHSENCPQKQPSEKVIPLRHPALFSRYLSLTFRIVQLDSSDAPGRIESSAHKGDSEQNSPAKQSPSGSPRRQPSSHSPRRSVSLEVSYPTPENVDLEPQTAKPWLLGHVWSLKVASQVSMPKVAGHQNGRRRYWNTTSITPDRRRAMCTQNMSVSVECHAFAALSQRKLSKA